MGENENEIKQGQEEVKKPEVSANVETEIGALFQRVATDDEFKKLLVEKPEEALAGYELTATQVLLIKSLSKEDLDKLTPGNLEEFFAADAAIYTPDEADLMDFEEYDPEDFEENDEENEDD